MDHMGKQPAFFHKIQRNQLLKPILSPSHDMAFINSALSSSNSFTRDSALLSCFFIFSWSQAKSQQSASSDHKNMLKWLEDGLKSQLI